MKAFFVRYFGGFKGVFFLLAMGLGLGLHLYTQSIVNQLREESRTTVRFYASIVARIAEEDDQSLGDLTFLFNEFILQTNFPLVLVNPEGIPDNWREIDVSSDDHSGEAITQVMEIVKRMGKESPPEVISYQDQVLGYLYYGDSHLIQKLQWLPYVEVGIIGIFILMGFLGYANIKKSEQRHIWVGMAKETAHQLGTPISSLMGWIEVMNPKKTDSYAEIRNEMQKDLQRLKQVSTRFSQIGSIPILKETDLETILRETVEYIRRRAPQISRPVTITESYDAGCKMALNADLFQWALENMLKNALDALDKPQGTIEVTMKFHPERKSCIIDLKDNGRGIDEEHRKKIFKPGHSTKKRGWGLGLSLAKRIIEEYHGGKLILKDTKVGVGTTLRIEL